MGWDGGMDDGRLVYGVQRSSTLAEIEQDRKRKDHQSASIDA